ncbi:uncharacterized protein [Macrobrachium rosenbergii]|uniref:uncharacterized protein isoform X2 n=1 Tax=Macrobrachium rosenbergii TaxID=79674 RepID=UPI0034D4CC4C
MLDTSRTWILLAIVLYMGIVCLAQVCPVIQPTVMDASSLSKIPTSCCADTSNTCLSNHNGQCQMKWLTGSCDYTTNVCSSRWYCTCCGSCNETNTNSQCKQAGGRCSKIAPPPNTMLGGINKS